MHSDNVRIMFPDEAGRVSIDEDGVRVLHQDFDVPDGMLAVRMQVGDLPVTIVGWIDQSESLPGLLRKVSDELDAILRERA